MQVLQEAEQTLREMAARKSTHAPFGAPWESWPTAQGGHGHSHLGSPPDMSRAAAIAAGQQRANRGMDAGLMDVDGAAGFDEFDDFLDILEVGE